MQAIISISLLNVALNCSKAENQRLISRESAIMRVIPTHGTAKSQSVVETIWRKLFRPERLVRGWYQIMESGQVCYYSLHPLGIIMRMQINR